MDRFPEKPDEISTERWRDLRTAVQQAKLLPYEGQYPFSDPDDNFGRVISVDGDRALIGAPGGEEAYMVERDPVSGNWSLSARLTADDGVSGDIFGISVALKGDVAVIGAQFDDDNGDASGSAYVFAFDGASWTQTQKIAPSDGAADDWFGASLGMTNSWLAVGATADDDNGTDAGSVYIYERDAGSWSFSQKLLALGGSSFDEFGYSIALTDDVMLIGTRLDDDNGIDSGSVRVFDRSGSTWSESSTLLSADGAAGDQFGVSISLDNGRALIGARSDDEVGPDSGAAFIFESSGLSWSQIEKLVPADGATSDQFGHSVYLAGDRAIVGAYLDDDSGGDSGSAYVFDFDGTTWAESTRLSSGDAQALDWFGYAVALCGDSALLGAHLDDDNGSESGSIYVFEFSGISWGEAAKLTPASSAAQDRFGYSVSLASDRALIGAFGDDDHGIDSGAAYVFDFDGTAWNETAKLTGGVGTAGHKFGYSVSLSGDRGLVGAYSDDENGIRSGSAYVFDFDGTVWSQSAKLIPDDGAAFDEFGQSVSLSADRALVGAHGNDDRGSASGAAYVFDFDGSAWSETVKLIAGDGAAGDQFGYSVSLVGDRALIGAFRDDDQGIDSGSAYVFDFDGTTWTETVKLTSGDGAPDDQLGFSVSLASDRVLVGSRLDDDNGSSSGSAYVFDFDGTSWNETTKLLPADGAASDLFGISVSLSGDRALVGAIGNDDIGADSGSAYVFAVDGSNWSETAKLMAVDGVTGDQLGYSVSLAGDRVLVGALSDDENGSDSGSAYVLGFNQPPVAEGDVLAALEDKPLSANVFDDNGSGADSDPDGDVFEVQSPGTFTAGGIGGSVDLAANGDLTYTPPVNASGVATFDYTIADPSGATDSATVTITVAPVNDQPTFTAGDPAAVLEDAGPQSVIDWVMFDPGAPNELQGVLGYTVSDVETPALFVAGPAVDSSGMLTFTPAADAFGTSTFDVIVQDDGGVVNGGVDTSVPQTFMITVDPVNDPPTFTASDPAAVPEDAGAQTVMGWANFDAGAPNEIQGVLGYSVSNVATPGLFAIEPAVDAMGNLTFTPAADAFGTSTFDVLVQDDGGVATGGVDTSDAQAFTITIDPVNDAPSFAIAGDVTEIEDGDYAEPWASAISPGPANESGQSVTFMTTVTGNPGLFDVAPSIDPSGTLTFTPVPDTTGSATIEVVAMDDGGTANGGTDLSDPAPFTIDVIAAADLTIDKTSGSFFTPPERDVSYTIVVSNPGPSDVTQATVTDTPPARLGNVTWTCSAGPGAACNPSGSIEINELVNLPEGTSVTYTLDATLLDDLNDPITNTASVTTPGGVLELVPANNTDSDTDLVGLFADGMESVEP